MSQPNQFTTIDDTIPAGHDFSATPVHAILPPDPTRGVVVIHELYGRQPEIDRVVERFAGRRYAAVAPDLFRAPSRFSCIRRTMHALGSDGNGEGPIVEQAKAVRAWLCGRTGLDEQKVGIIGFCFGGGFALAVGRGWGAISTNYGMVPKSDEALRGLGPTIGCYGANDRIFGKLGPVLERRLAAAGVTVESHTFQGVGHSLLTDGHHPVAAFFSRPLFELVYRPEIAEDAWGRILAFFDHHLS